MPRVLNQSQGAQDRSFNTPIPEQSPKHRRSRSQQIQKHNSHFNNQTLPPLIDPLPPHLSHSDNDPHSPRSPQTGQLPPIYSLQAKQSPYYDPVQYPSPISPEEMEHQRPRPTDEPIDDHDWVSSLTFLHLSVVMTSIGILFQLHYSARNNKRRNESTCFSSAV
jgi:hypothetical protein